MAGRSSEGVRRAAGVLLAATLMACAPPGAPPPVPPGSQAPVPLPPMTGAGDPMRATVTSAAYAFGAPGRLDGRPAEAARAVARLEWLATELPGDPAWNEAAPITAGLLRRGRDSVRDSIGIPRSLPADAVARSMIEAAEGLDRGDRQAGAAALAPVAAGQGAALLARLDHLPPSREAGSATAIAYGELIRIGRDTGLNE
ncbi:hypothetical protein [Falsiroseomonas ponticola]|jgi:hypothetical protein|uniref:hypothetical protein n=1 Tax=Falsiroseomonas ponticola TaxID=2786951 RepID=UPI0019319C49|nr:hypothetical protein [Roseomonas ponticola]